MAGKVSGFDPAGFREGIRFAMNLGAPPEVSLRATFFFPKAMTADVPLDSSGAPYAPAEVDVAEVKPPVQRPCGIEDASGAPTNTHLGKYGDAIVVTLLDEDFAAVNGFEFLVISGLRYNYDYEMLPGALGTVVVHRVVCTGEGRR